MERTETSKEIIDTIRNLYIEYFESENNLILRKIHELELRAKFKNCDIPSLESIEKEAVLIVANRIYNDFISEKKDSETLNQRSIIRVRLKEEAKRLGITDQLIDALHGKQPEFNLENEEISDPINYDYCDACVDNYLNYSKITGKPYQYFQSRCIRMKSSKERKEDTCTTDFLNLKETKIIIEGLKVIISKIKNNNMTRLNPQIVSKIIEIGINEIEEYINTGKTTNLNIINFIQQLKKVKYDFNKEHCGEYSSEYLFKSDDKDNNNNVYRIYLNTPVTEDVISFLTEYCIECQRQLMSFDMKSFYNRKKESQDVTILYSTYGDMNKKISILKKLLEKYPDLGLGTPPPACAKINGVEELGICHVGESIYDSLRDKLYNKYTYNDYINHLFKSALSDTLNSYGYRINDVERELALEETKDIVRKICSSSKHDEFIKKLCFYMHVEHNKKNGYAEDAKKNIALDTWYIDKMREKWGIIKKEPSGFSM